MNTATIRLALGGELPQFDSEAATVYLAEEDGAITGHVAVRTIQGLAWITDLKYWGKDPVAAARLMIKARNEIKDDLKVTEYRLTIDPNSPALFETLMEHGHILESIVMKGFIKNREAL